ncbi:hypothetical protein CRG98_011532 [Punica granatum]|uniref:Uncharacterized protein n=1 Tax=Punica granatum TaxID=22663 RepID=A0A2I0KJH2_PUNGR|nr:hypothetical protein CRG98_011532 [Punica granatum]
MGMGEAAMSRSWVSRVVRWLWAFPRPRPALRRLKDAADAVGHGRVCFRRVARF